MGTITLPNFRTTADVTMNTRLKDGGVAIDWAGLTNIKAWLYSDAQKAMAGRCDVTIDQTDSTKLVCEYSANKPQYLGVQRLIIQAKYMGRTKTYDKPVFNFVPRTADQEGTQIVIDDPEVDVEIEVEDVSSSILDTIIAAALDAAARAEAAAQEAEHMVDIHTGPAGKSPYIGENGHWYEWDEETHQYVDTETNAKGDTGETPDISIGTVTTVEPGQPAGASMGGTPEAPVLNLSIPQGRVGATPNFTIGTVTTGQPGTPVVITITGTAEAPVLNIQIPQGMKGDTGVSADYPITIHNGLDSDATDEALAAFQGKVLQGEITQLEHKIDGLEITITEADVTSESGRWVDNNGVIGTNSSGVLHRASAIDLTGIVKFNLTTNLSWASENAAYLCDDDGEILEIIARTGESTSVSNKAVPDGATKLYVNFATAFTYDGKALGIEGRVDEKILEIQKEADSRYVILQAISPSSINANVTAIGQIYFSTNLKKFYVCTDAANQTFEVYPANERATYWCDGRSYLWNGTDLIPAKNEQVIEIYAFSTGAPSGFSKGQYYYNTNQKKLYQNNGGTIYKSREVALSDSTLYLYKNNVYVWDGTDLILANTERIDEAIAEYAAVKTAPNTTPLGLVEGNFESGNLENGTGNNLTATNVIRLRTHILVVPGSVISFSTSNSYRIDFFEYYADKTYKSNTYWATGTGSHTISERTEYIRICVASPEGVQTAPVWNDIALSVTPSKKYEYTRAAAAEDNTDFSAYELPIVAPGPQKPADGSNDADFDAETLTPSELYGAFDALLDSLQKPDGYYTNSPKFGTRFSKVGRDASNTYDIYAYVFGKRNRYAWKYADALFAWKNGNTILYTDSISPRSGDTLYSNAGRTDSGKTVSSFSVASLTGSDSATYSRSLADDIKADVFYTIEPQKMSSYASRSAYTKDGALIGTATASGGDALVLNSKTYTRCEDYDYHTEQKGTVFLWGNEHGPQSDPAECAIVLYRMAKDLCNGCRTNPFLSWLKDNFMFVMIPCVNPWGLANQSRNNYNYVNINRNYSTPGWSVVADADKGSYAGDQPETQFVMNTCRAFSPSVSIDIHCLGYVTAGNVGRVHYEGQIVATGMLALAKDTMNGFSFNLSSYGVADPDTKSQGADWINYQGLVGGLIEMNAGPYSQTFNGAQHSAHIMESDYTLLLNMIRVWLQEFDESIDLTKLHLR